MSKHLECEGQLHLFLGPGDKPRYEFSDIINIVISHARNFRIEIPYLLEHLSQYNNYLKKDWMDDLEKDNLLLREMFRGIQNSKGTPPEIFDGLNALEIYLIEAGISKRKYIHLGEMVITPKNNVYRQSITVKRNLDLHTQSRLKQEGHLDGKHLYEIVTHLLTATGIGRIYDQYQKDWQTIFQWENPGKKQKRFKRLNPYDPSTLKQRMDYIERKYPDLLWKFKKVLAEPFIPERIVRMDMYGNSKEVMHPEGFVTPGKTYRRGISGKSFWNLREYAKQVYDYFQRKEKDIKYRANLK